MGCGGGGGGQEYVRLGNRLKEAWEWEVVLAQTDGWTKLHLELVPNPARQPRLAGSREADSQGRVTRVAEGHFLPCSSTGQAFGLCMLLLV